MKLRVLYGAPLSADRPARRRKMKVLLLSGAAVFPFFLLITYAIVFETRAFYLLLIGLLAGLACVPVAFYSYAAGIGLPWRRLWSERRGEMKALGLKVGFFYGFELYWMILGVVEFLFGYHTFRAALISFVASAVARDGFEIGYLRAREENRKRTTFPDDRSIAELWRIAPKSSLLFIGGAILSGGTIGGLLGPLLSSPRLQTLAVGLVGAVWATFAYAALSGSRLSFSALLKFFIWPALTMACSYFFILAYLYRIIFRIQFGESVDLALLTAACAGWITTGACFLGHLKGENLPVEESDPQKAVSGAAQAPSPF